jgi:hypothetical protein
MVLDTGAAFHAGEKCDAPRCLPPMVFPAQQRSGTFRGARGRCDGAHSRSFTPLSNPMLCLIEHYYVVLTSRDLRSPHSSCHLRTNAPCLPPPSTSHPPPAPPPPPFPPQNQKHRLKTGFVTCNPHHAAANPPPPLPTPSSRAFPLAVATSNSQTSRPIARAASPPSLPKPTAKAAMRLRNKFEKMRNIELQQSE